MALTCQLSLNYRAYSAGMTPAPMMTLQVYNPNAAAIAVTGIAFQFYDTVGRPVNAPANLPVPAMGPGQTVVAPALSSIFFGPFPIVVGSGANANQFLAAPQTTPNATPMPRQLGMREPAQYIIGAVVQGSDGSSNEAGRDSVLVTYASLPPRYSQGGVTDFVRPSNSSLVAAVH